MCRFQLKLQLQWHDEATRGDAMRRTLAQATLCMHALAWTERKHARSKRERETLAQILFRKNRQLRYHKMRVLCKIYMYYIYVCLFVCVCKTRRAQMQRQTKATTKCEPQRQRQLSLRSLKDTVTVTKLQCALRQC